MIDPTTPPDEASESDQRQTRKPTGLALEAVIGFAIAALLAWVAAAAVTDIPFVYQGL